MNRNIRHLLKLIFGVATLYFACVWAKFFPAPAWLPEDVEPLTVIAGALLFFISWWEEIFEKVPQAFRREPKHLTNPHRHLGNEAIGRKRDLHVLRRKVLSAQKPVVICGVGGLGKTTLAQMFWQQNKKRFDHVAWLVSDATFTGDKERRADNAAFFLQSFTDNTTLHKALNIKLEPQDRPVKQFEQIVATLGEVSGKNLLVIDNVPEAASAYFDTLSGLENWKILLTSRDAIQNTEIFELGVLEPKEATTVFWRIYAPPPITTQKTGEKTKSLNSILQGIGYHTLTIELVAAYAQEKNLSVEGLLAELQHRGLSKLDEVDLANPKSHKKQSFNAHLRDTFLLELSSDEQEIMRYCCILPPEGADVDPSLMTEEKLREYFGKDDDSINFHNVLKGLARLHWLVERAGTFFCHPVVAETAKDQLKPDAENCAVLIKNITKLLIPSKNEPVITRAPYLPLGETVFQGIFKKDKDRNFTQADEDVAQLALWLDRVMGDVGQLYKSLDYSLKMVEMREILLSPQHIDLAISYGNLAVTYGNLGDHQKQLEFNLKALSIRETTLSPEHPDLANSYNNLSATYWNLGEHQKELDYALKALAIREKNLSDDHPELARTYVNLGETYRTLGESQKALDYVLKGLAIREKILPPEHPDIAWTYNILALTYGRLKNQEEEFKYHKKAFAMYEKILPAGHPDLGISLNNLAEAYRRASKYKEALEYHLKALTIWEKALPAEHPYVGGSNRNIAWTYHDLKDLDKACAHMQRAVAIWEKSLPPEHSNLVESKKYLANWEKERQEQQQ